jgi:mono/diheme cytochrome c family protein
VTERREEVKHMKLLKPVLLSTVVLGLIFSLAYAAGNVEKGKALFNDSSLGTNGSNCGTCHPGGQGLEKAGAMGKKEWTTPAGVRTSLEDAINTCITMALKGEALDTKSQKMKDLVAYIDSLGKKKEMAPGY